MGLGKGGWLEPMWSWPRPRSTLAKCLTRHALCMPRPQKILLGQDMAKGRRSTLAKAKADPSQM